LKQRATATAERYAAQAKEGISNAINQNVPGASRLDRLRGPSERASNTGENELGDEEMEEVNNFRGLTGSNGAPETNFSNDAAGRSTATKVESDVTETVGKDAGEEAASGVLDAIPGLDVIGVIGGAVMAGIAAHKAHKQAKEAARGMMNTVVAAGTSYQAGVSD
jgi:hypothetical protein